MHRQHRSDPADVRKTCMQVRMTLRCNRRRLILRAAGTRGRCPAAALRTRSPRQGAPTLREVSRGSPHSLHPGARARWRADARGGTGTGRDRWRRHRRIGRRPSRRHRRSLESSPDRRRTHGGHRWKRPLPRGVAAPRALRRHLHAGRLRHRAAGGHRRRRVGHGDGEHGAAGRRAQRNGDGQRSGAHGGYAERRAGTGDHARAPRCPAVWPHAADRGAADTRCVGREHLRRNRDRRHEHHHDRWRSDQRARQPGRRFAGHDRRPVHVRRRG